MPCQPYVLSHLATDMNISGPFMQLHKWDLLLSKGQVKINSKNFDLLSPRKFIPAAPIMLLADTTCQANSITFVPAAIGAHVPPNQSHLHMVTKASKQFTNKKGLLAQIRTIVEPDDKGIIKVAIFNETDQPIKVHSQEHYGKVYFADSTTDKHDRAVMQLDFRGLHKHKKTITPSPEPEVLQAKELSDTEKRNYIQEKYLKKMKTYTHQSYSRKRKISY